MSRLEERYRNVLRVLPASYRAAWEEDMVGAFLASVHTDDPEAADYLADYGRPGWAEVASVAALAVRLRLGLDGGTRRSVAWGSAVRLVALLGLLAGAVLGIVEVGVHLWLVGRIPGLPAPAWVVVGATNFWVSALHLGGLVWVVAYLALLRGHWQVARALAALGLAAGLTATVITWGPPSVTQWLYLLANAILVLAVGAYQGHHEPPARIRPWLLALPLGAAATAGLQLVGGTTEALWALLDPAGMYSTAVLGAAAGYLVARRLGRVDDASTWPHALAILAGGVLALRLLTVLDYLRSIGQEQRDIMVTVGLAQVCALLAVGLPLATHTRRALRRLRTEEPRGATMHST